MAFSGVQGHKLEINVVGCNQLKDTWYGRHKPYVALLYGTSSHQTKPSRDGGKNPSFNEKFEFSLIEGLYELSINVFSSHNILDSFIGHGKVNLEKVFREGYSATLVPLESLTGKQAGEVNLILHYHPIANVHQQQGVNYGQYTQQSAQAGSSPYVPPISLYPPNYGARPSYVPPISQYPPQCGTQTSYAPQSTPSYPPQYKAQESQGSATYPPQYRAQESQGSATYPPQYKAQESQGSSSYPRYQEAPAKPRPQQPRYTKQDIHDAKIRMMDAQIRRSAETANRMSDIGTDSWRTVYYTNRYEDSMDRMNRL